MVYLLSHKWNRKQTTLYWILAVLAVIAIIVLMTNNSRNKSNGVGAGRTSGCQEGKVLSCVCLNKSGFSSGSGTRTCKGGEWSDCNCPNSERTVPLYFNQPITPSPAPTPSPTPGASRG